MKLVKKKIGELKFAEYNPRKISSREMEKLKKSIREFGYIEPIIWNRKTGNVVGGNQRLKALIELGVKEVDIIEVNLDENKEKALNVALNKISGEWDDLGLFELLEEIHKKNKNLFDITGFNDEDLEELRLVKEDIEINIKEKEFDENITTTNKCPKCGYEW